MRNVFEPVKLQGKLVAKCIETGSIAPADKIRDVQIRNAFKNGEVLAVDPDNGRVTRLNASIFGKSTSSGAKLNFMNVTSKRDPQIMFDNLTRLTKMVARGVQPSLLVTGGAGLGKTFLVKQTLQSCGLRESYEFVHYKGRSTAAGMFITLFQNSNKIVVFDDCDSIFKDADAVNMLKAALDSYDTRRISYITSKPLKDEHGDPIPTTFEFTGKVIFISNLQQNKVDSAVRSRSFTVDITLTPEQLLKRMEEKLPEMEVKVPMNIKLDALKALKQVNEKFEGVELNFRSLIKAIRIRKADFPNWPQMIAEQCIDPNYKPKKSKQDTTPQEPLKGGQPTKANLLSEKAKGYT